ncbi:sugar ABC transporter substrate-binding protein [Aliiglaciecola lipolytica]|uniref:Simple sugar transport system substrate-binding protein n=1 Tax=Aliiglaciecola lipolytica E3 TaxID=1127673 RepID=K6YRI3_9ALTE|nr:sugar ABC transporter substrate-binding protein [Aliiglaciecola lipolytica]GAC13920.1 simple sugar transport system substrate-binding protein [Aliiglaciecola lipolytica E3]
MNLQNKLLFVMLTCLLTSAFVATDANAKGERFILISHAPDSDPWWNTIKNAVKEASERMDVSVLYRNPSTGDLADMARIVEQAVASNPDGIIVTIADFDVLKNPLEKATKKGIPLVTINSGTHQQSQDLGALMHIGQPEYQAGFMAGEKAKQAGVKQFVCVNHYITNPSSVERCQGYADALGVTLGGNMLDSSQDPGHIEKKVQAYLRSHPATDGILTLGPTSAIPVINLVNKMRLQTQVHFSTFDLSNEITSAISQGTIDFAIDQQPYLQGFMAVTILALNIRYGIVPSNDMYSGPAFITQKNVAQVESLAGTVR